MADPADVAVAGPADVGVAVRRVRVEGEWLAGCRQAGPSHRFHLGKSPVSAGSRATQVLQETTPHGGRTVGAGALSEELEQQEGTNPRLQLVVEASFYS